MLWQIIGAAALAVFYGVYLGKMAEQRRKGIQTDQMARGKGRKGRLFWTELVMKIATYSVLLAEAASIACNTVMLPAGPRILGAVLAVLGDGVFAASVLTMRDSWRAGIAERDKTEMVTWGIYSVSRNPAFLGFDLVYLGILLLFFNWVLLGFSVFAAVMLHLQILQEEAYLPSAFGAEYLSYRDKVCRYLGRK